MFLSNVSLVFLQISLLLTLLTHHESTPPIADWLQECYGVAFPSTHQLSAVRLRKFTAPFK